MRLHNGLLRSSDKSNSNIIEHEISNVENSSSVGSPTSEIFIQLRSKKVPTGGDLRCMYLTDVWIINLPLNTLIYTRESRPQPNLPEARRSQPNHPRDRRPQPNHLSAGKGTPPQPSHWKTRKEWRLQPQHQMARKGGALPNHPRGWERAKERARCDDVC